MGTRSTISLVGEDGQSFHYYRHYDGYLAEAGADLLRKMRLSKDFTQFSESLKFDQKNYRLINIPADVSDEYDFVDRSHSDAEYRYRFTDVSMLNGWDYRDVKVEVYHRPNGEWELLVKSSVSEKLKVDFSDMVQKSEDKIRKIREEGSEK